MVAPARKKYSRLKLAVLLLLLSAALFEAHHLGWLEPREILRRFAILRASGDDDRVAALYALFYGAATAVAIPSAPFALAGGVIFGLLPGIAVGWVGAMLGAAGGYWLARGLGKDTVCRALGKHRTMLDKLDDLNGFLPLLRLRLIPVLPLGVVNVMAGLTGMDFRAYLAATAIGILPSTVVYVYFADALFSRNGGTQQMALARIALASGLLLLLSFAPAIVHWFRGPDESSVG